MIFIDAQDLAQQARRNVHGQMTEVVREIASQYHNLLRTYETRFADANRTAVLYAQDKMLESYDAVHSGNFNSYRANASGKYKRYSGGVLRQALASSAMTYYDGRSVEFINSSYLDKRARQWYRLNFGTESGAGRPARSRNITFMGVATGLTVSLDRFGPSEDFTIPEGFWMGQGGVRRPGEYGRGDEFVPWKYWRFVKKNSWREFRKMTGNKPRRYLFGPQVGAIGARRFIDDGVDVLAQEFPRRQSQILEDIAHESVQRGRRLRLGSEYRYVRVKTFRTALDVGLFSTRPTSYVRPDHPTEWFEHGW